MNNLLTRQGQWQLFTLLLLLLKTLFGALLLKFSLKPKGKIGGRIVFQKKSEGMPRAEKEKSKKFDGILRVVTQ